MQPYRTMGIEKDEKHSKNETISMSLEWHYLLILQNMCEWKSKKPKSKGQGVTV